MNKKVFALATISLSAVFSGLNSLAVFAEDIQPRTTNYDNQIEAQDTNGSTETDNPDELRTNCDRVPTPANCAEVTPEEIEEGTSGEPLVVCTDEGEPGCETPAEEDDNEGDTNEDGEPLRWPMYVSFAALGVAALFIIILNLTSPKIK